MERYKDIIGGLFWILVAAAMYKASFEIRSMAVGAGSTSFVGSGFMPRLVAIGMMACGSMVIWQGVKKLRISAGIVCAQDDISFKERYLPVIASLVLLIVYIAFMEMAGFLTMTVIYLFGQMFILAATEHRKPVMFLLVSAISAAVIFYTFVEVFQLMLPESRIF